MKPKSYSEAGVSIERGDKFAQYIAAMKSPAVSRDIGGFAGGIELDLTGIEKPVMLSSTDGVGTKLLVARKLGIYNSLGIDLVAMCVNDLIVAGVKPQIFLDYIACGELREGLLQEIISGVVEGCEQAGCVLAGGETAEMPDLYDKGDFDLAGFCTGVGDKSQLLPKTGLIEDGDVMIGLPSTGIHSNGLSLARKVIDQDDTEVWKQLLTPTRIYVKELSTLLETGKVKAAAHITGGGLEGNVKRILPENSRPDFTWTWPEPEIFSTIRNQGQLAEEEMRKVFNMGLGIVLVVSASNAAEVLAVAESHDIPALRVGTVTCG